MKLFIRSILFILLFFQFSCNKIEKSLDNWTTNMCCEVDSSRIQLNKFSLLEGNRIVLNFCKKKYPKARLQLSLSIKSKENNTYKSLFDIVSDDLVNNDLFISLNRRPNGFQGKFLKIKSLQNGKYRLYINEGAKCGEILFIVKDRNITSNKFLCIDNCK